MKKNSIIWGSLLIIIGLLVMLDSFHVLVVSWWDFLKLWPLLLILLGLGRLPLKPWIKNTAAAVMIFGCLALVVQFDTDERKSFRERLFEQMDIDEGDWHTFKSSFSNFDKMFESKHILVLDSGVVYVPFEIAVNESDNLFVGKSPDDRLLFESVSNGSFLLNTTVSDSVAHCSLLPADESEAIKSELKLLPDYIYALDITTKANYNRFDFSELSVSSLKLSVKNAGSLLKMSFGEELAQTDVELKFNQQLDKVEISVPAGVGISLETPDLLPSEWNHLKKDGKRWVSDNYNTAKKKIDFRTANIDGISFIINIL